MLASDSVGMTIADTVGMTDTFGDLSFAREELEAAVMEAALEACRMPHVQDASTRVGFMQVARNQSCGRFVDALEMCGLLSELPALTAPFEDGIPRVTILAPSDDAIGRLQFDGAMLRRITTATPLPFTRPACSGAE